MFKRSILDQITLCADGCVHLKFLKQVVDDDGTVIASDIHRAFVHSWEDVSKVVDFTDERLALKHAPVENKDFLNSASPKRRAIPKKD